MVNRAVLPSQPSGSFDLAKAAGKTGKSQAVCLNQALESLINWTKFSNFRKSFRVIFYSLRVRSRQTGSFSVDEMERAKLAVLQLIPNEKIEELSKYRLKLSEKSFHKN